MKQSGLAVGIGFALLMLLPAGAQAANGIGFAQAEEGTWYCRGDDPVATLNCARKKCLADSGGQECYRTQWCFSARWTGLMTVFLPDFHSTEILCGAPSKRALTAGLKAFCADNKNATDCSVFLIIDPAGKKYDISDVNFRGPKAK